MHDNASEIYNVYLETYFDQYLSVSDNEKRKMGNKRYILINLLKHMTMLAALKNKKSTNTTRKSDKEESVDLFDMSPQDGDEKKVKEGIGLKI